MKSSCLLESFFNEYVKLTPSLANYIGDHSMDHRIENSLGKEYISQYKQLVYKYINKLKSKQNDHDHNCCMQDIVLRWGLHMEVEGFRYSLELMPISSHNNIATDLAFTEKNMYHNSHTPSRIQDYVNIIDTVVENMQRGMAVGLVLPRRICLKMMSDIQSVIRTHGCVPGTEDATKRLLSFVQHTYLPSCRSSIGFCSLPRGKEMYVYLVKQCTSLDITPEEVHAYGLSEVDRISREIHDIGYVPKAVYYERKQDVLSAYRRQRVRVTRMWKRYFPYTLKHNYRVQSVPESMEKTAAGAFYVTSTYDGKFRGTFYVNTRNLGARGRENPTYTMYVLSLHEGFHHYQFQYMIENKDRVPLHMIYGFETDAYVEGMAHYAEGLGDFKNTDEKYGKLVYEMFRAVRLVVDTGVHYYGWSWGKALAYMRKYLSSRMGEDELVTELERYICIPGQALSYSIGKKVILELREKYLNNFGSSDSSIRSFHQLILEDGILPLNVLTQKVAKVVQ